MVQEGVIVQFAIGGAIGAIYYLEPFETSDLNVFVHLQADGNELAILEPIYSYLREAGYKEEQEFIQIEGVPVQFLPSISHNFSFGNGLLLGVRRLVAALLRRHFGEHDQSHFQSSSSIASRYNKAVPGHRTPRSLAFPSSAVIRSLLSPLITASELRCS